MSSTQNGQESHGFDLVEDVKETRSEEEQKRIDGDVNLFIDWFEHLDNDDQIIYLSTVGEGPRYNHPRYQSDRDLTLYRESLRDRSEVLGDIAKEEYKKKHHRMISFWRGVTRMRIGIIPIILILLMALSFMPNPGLSNWIWSLTRGLLIGAVFIGGIGLFYVLNPKDINPFTELDYKDLSHEDLLSRVLSRDESYLADQWFRIKTGLTSSEYEALPERERTIIDKSGILDLDNPPEIMKPRKVNGQRGNESHFTATGMPKKEYRNFRLAINALHELEEKFRLERFNAYLCESGTHWHVGHASNDVVFEHYSHSVD